MATDNTAKLTKLVVALVELSDAYEEKRGAIVAEMDALLAGKGGIGVKLKILKGHWAAAWTARHHETCDFDHVKHTAFLKKKLALFSVDEIQAKMSSYVASDDPYYVRARHPFTLFMSSFQTWRGVPVSDGHDAEGAARLRDLRGGTL